MSVDYLPPQVANKLLELHIHLKDLGHPEYLKPRGMRYLECSIDSYHADGMVHTYNYNSTIS